MAGRLYSAQFSGTSFAGVSASAVQDLWLLVAASNKPLQVEEIILSATGQTTAVELVLALRRLKATVTNGSGGTAPTAIQVDARDDTAAAATVHANDTSRGSSSGTNQIIRTDTVQLLNGWQWLPPPEHRILIAPAEAFVLGLEVAPAAAVTLYGSIVFREFA